jgi:putative transposase
MLVNQAFKYELKPNNRQVGLFMKNCGVARFAWNWGLARRIELYRTKEGKERFTTDFAQHKELVAIKKSEFPWMYEASKCAPQEALRNLDKAYSNFYRGLKGSKKIGLPKFRKKGVYDSFSLTGAIKTISNAVHLPRIGMVRTKESSSKFKGRILSATVSREANRWYCSLCVEVDRVESNSITDEVVGIDLGLNEFAVISNGKEYKHIDAPKPLKKVLSKAKRLSKQQSRKQKGSNNRKKANLRLAMQHRKVKNIRKDFLNKLTSELAKTKSVIVIEDLNVQGMQSKKRHLGRSVSDVSWGEFRRQLEYKTLWYGSRLIKYPRFEPSSKKCSKCGAINQDLELSDRIWICQNCGATHDRDENASDVLRDYGLKILATESSSGSNACGECVSPILNKAVLVEAGSKRVHDK